MKRILIAYSPLKQLQWTLMQVTVTQRAGHAFDMMTSITDTELNSYDGVIAVVSCQLLHYSMLFRVWIVNQLL